MTPEKPLEKEKHRPQPSIFGFHVSPRQKQSSLFKDINIIQKQHLILFPIFKVVFRKSLVLATRLQTH